MPHLILGIEDVKMDRIQIWPLPTSESGGQSVFGVLQYKPPTSIQSRVQGEHREESNSLFCQYFTSYRLFSAFPYKQVHIELSLIFIMSTLRCCKIIKSK